MQHTYYGPTNTKWIENYRIVTNNDKYVGIAMFEVQLNYYFIFIHH